MPKLILPFSLSPLGMSSFAWGCCHLSLFTLLGQTGSGPGFRGHSRAGDGPASVSESMGDSCAGLGGPQRDLSVPHAGPAVANSPARV